MFVIAMFVVSMFVTAVLVIAMFVIAIAFFLYSLKKDTCIKNIYSYANLNINSACNAIFFFTILSYPIVLQSYRIMPVYCSIVLLSCPSVH